MHFQVWDNFDNWKPFKNDEKCFLIHLKKIFFLKKFKFLSWLFGHVWKRLDEKNKINFKFYDVTARLTNYFNIYIAQYLQK